MKFLSLATLSFLCASLFGEQDSDLGRVSEAFGHIIEKNLERVDVKFDLQKVVKGIEEAAAGKDSPMSEQECIDAIAALQKKNLQILSQKNLEEAEEFLSEKGKSSDFFSLEEGKVLYQVLSSGNGSQVKPHSTPLIRCSVKKLDGSLLGAANQEELVSLDETIPGLKIGLLGMKEGEKRTLYVHPSLCYGNKKCFPLPPNCLVIFEVEVLRSCLPAKLP